MERERAVDDGDTVKLRLGGQRRTRDVRLTGINAMELRRYSHTPYARRGACHAVEAAALLDYYIHESHGRVRLAAQNPRSRSGRRIRRSV